MPGRDFGWMQSGRWRYDTEDRPGAPGRIVLVMDTRAFLTPAQATDPVSDHVASAEYRRHAVAVMARRALRHIFEEEPA